MRIGVVHSFYREDVPSGENIAVAQQVSALRDAGIQVTEFFRWTDQEGNSATYPLLAATQVASGWDFKGARAMVQDADIDLLLVHNLFPNFGTRWLSHVDAPVISIIHNFRFSCANGLLYRAGRICTDCPDSGSRNSVRNSCYRDSKIASVPLALATRGGAVRNRQLLASNLIITQADRPFRFLLEQGVPPSKLMLIPGFIETGPSRTSPAPTDPRFVFVGRSSTEKGLDELLAIWPRGYLLDVIGSNAPSESRIPRPEVTYLGIQERTWVQEHIGRYTALVFPGRVWEGAYPLVVREALAAGVPVVALVGSSAADLIDQSGAGRTYADGSVAELATALDDVVAEAGVLRFAARELALREFSVGTWLERMLGSFARVLSS